MLREGVEVMVANCGGIEVESNWESVKRILVDIGEEPTEVLIHAVHHGSECFHTISPQYPIFWDEVVRTIRMLTADTRVRLVVKHAIDT